jgi:hypothetical protein
LHIPGGHQVGGAPDGVYLIGGVVQVQICQFIGDIGDLQPEYVGIQVESEAG